MSAGQLAEDASLPFVVVDVFTDGPFGGNPLAIVMGGEQLSGEQMQRIAREFNLSETTFPLLPSEKYEVRGADYHLRIFTPAVELPFAGHPSIGSAWWLSQAGHLPTGQLRQRCGEGVLPIDVSPTGATLTGGSPRVSEPVDAAPALRAVGLSRDDLAGPEVRVASAGLPYAVLVVSPDSLARCRPDLEALSTQFSYPNDATGVYVVSWDEERKRAAARMFAGDLGIPEDPATGSAALALGAYLAAAGFLPDGEHHLVIEQGREMGRASLLEVDCEVRGRQAQWVKVTGQAVLVSEGRITRGSGAAS